MRKTILTLLLSLLVSVSAFAEDSGKLAVLEKRVGELEKRIAELEAIVAPVAAKARAEKNVELQRANAKRRMRKDSDVYSREQLQEIERLYQVANRKWGSQEGADSLKQLIEKFGKANRTGCALLYLGQMDQGEEMKRYLEKSITDYGDCYYGDGVQVGAYARFQLANYYKEKGEYRCAAELFEEIAEKYPNAIDHRGRPLAESMKK